MEAPFALESFNRVVSDSRNVSAWHEENYVPASNLSRLLVEMAGVAVQVIGFGSDCSTRSDSPFSSVLHDSTVTIRVDMANLNYKHTLKHKTIHILGQNNIICRELE